MRDCGRSAFRKIVGTQNSDLVVGAAILVSLSLPLVIARWIGLRPQSTTIPEWLAALIFSAVVLAATTGGFFSLLRLRRLVVSKLAFRSAVKNARPYYFLLRSFNDDINVDGPDGERVSLDPAGGLVTVVGHSVLARVATALDDFGAVVVLQPLRLRHPADAAPTIDIACSDDDWLRSFRILAQDALAIVAVPAASAGLMKELEILHEIPSLWEKTVVFIPPRLEAEGLLTSSDNSREIGAQWESIERDLTDSGVELPCPDGRGLFYFPSRGTTYPFGSPDWSKMVSSIRAAFAKVRSDLPLDSRPLLSALIELHR